MKKARKPRPGGGSLLAAEVPVKRRAASVAAEIERARVAFRDVTRSTDSRTVIAALVPPHTFLVNSAPYLVFIAGHAADRAACLGLMDSLVFDWQARRFVETHLNFFVLEGLRLPKLSDDGYARIGRHAARLSCIDDRFADFAREAGVEWGPLSDEEHQSLRLEIDALVAYEWGLDEPELEVTLADFTLDAVPEKYRLRLRDRLSELRSQGGW
jgi:hypothetical protein